MNNNEVISALARKMASGELRVEHVLPVIRKLSDNEKITVSDSELLELLRPQSGESVPDLLGEIEACLHRKILKYRHLKQTGSVEPSGLEESLSDLPLDCCNAGWRDREDIVAELEQAIKYFRDCLFVLKFGDKLPVIREKLMTGLRMKAMDAVKLPEWGYISSSDAFAEVFEELYLKKPDLNHFLGDVKEAVEKNESDKRIKIIAALSGNLESITGETDEKLALDIISERYAFSTDRKEKGALINILCSWPTDSAVPLLNSLIKDLWEQERAAMIFTLRFGQQDITDWTGWQQRLRHNIEKYHDFVDQTDKFTTQNRELLFGVWYSTLAKQNPLIMNALSELCDEKIGCISPEEFVSRYDHLLEDREKNIILNPPSEEGTDEAIAESVPVTSPPPLPPEKIELPDELEPVFVEPPTEREKKQKETALPSLWQNHIQPFFAENWYMVAGIFMVIAGSSLLAFYTWDKHWLVPYTIMPLLLAFFTAGLAGVGSWVEKRGEEFWGMAAMLRGAAIGLLPVNFMAVALLSNDARVSHKIIFVPLMGLIYLVLGGWGLRRWCSAMHKSLGNLLGLTLLLLNALVIIGPLSKSFNNLGSGGLNIILGSGFYLGFAAMAFAVINFTRHILDREMASEKRIPWFFGATLVVTFLQVFAWVHGYLGYLPHVFTYAPMVILTGGLVLLVEKRALQLKDESSMHEVESFLGFALIFIGVLMGMPDGGMRILSLELAGIIWMYQALSRKHPLHYWISLTFIVLGAASIVLLRSPAGCWLPTGPWMPILGILIAVSMSAFIYFADKYKNQMFKEAATGMQTVMLAVTSVAAVLAQWHYASKPVLTAIYLIIVTAVFMWRAFRDQKLRWLHTAMLILALVLPYIGCVDIMHKTIRGNSMVFGLAVLSLLWLVAIWLVRHPLMVKARSTVVMFYGVTALIAMIVRVVIQQGVPGNVFMDYTGPLLIAAVLVVITYYSRSLIPPAIAAVILIILFPELKSHFHEEFDRLGWGTGFGSAWTALGLIIGSFILRKLKFLEELGEGDLFLGRAPFYFRRFDHTLFTWPLIASAVFLIVKTDTITFVKNLIHDGHVSYAGLTGMPVKTSLALLITGVCWILLAVYHRQHRQAIAGVHLGWIWGLVGITCGYYALANDPHWETALLLDMIVLQTSYFVYRFLLQKKLLWAEELLTKRILYVLRDSSHILALICIVALFFMQPESLLPLGIFIAAQLIWHGVKTRNMSFGVWLYFLMLINVVAWTTPGVEKLFVRAGENLKFAPTLYFLLGIQLVYIIFEFKKDFYKIVEPVMLPCLFLGSLCTVFAVFAGFADALYFTNLNGFEQVVLLMLVFVTARAQASTPLALTGILLAYMYLQPFPENATLFDKLQAVVSPWKLSVLALGLVIIGRLGQMIYAKNERILTGHFNQLFYRRPSLKWLWIPAMIFAVGATIYQTCRPEYRSDSIQSLSPFINAASIGYIGYCWNLKYLFSVAVGFWALGNIHQVRIYVGDFFLVRGLKQIHLFCLGLASTMLEASLVKVMLRKDSLSVFVNRASYFFAFIVISLLSVSYFVNPNLSEITWVRFATSGSMTLLAGLYFRRAARKPGPGEGECVLLSEALYHYGLSITIWCFALIIPWFRTSTTALFALGLPVIYFYLHAELKRGSDEEISARYRNSAATLSFVILVLYLFRFAFRMVLFPDSPVNLMHYHYSAPAIVLLGIIMFRLRGLGGTTWLAFYGGLALMTGSYFTFTMFPKMSPFHYPVNSAWCAIVFGHFWTMLSYERSPIRTAIQEMSRLNDETWHNLRRGWGYFLLAATQVSMVWGLMHFIYDGYMVAPLLAGGATIFLHQGIIKRSPGYYGAAAFEFLLALHAGFLVPSWLPKEYVIWCVILMWAVMLAVHELIRKKLEDNKISGVYIIFTVLVMMHVFYHGVNSTVGLWAVAAGAVLAALTPCSTRSTSHGGKLIPAAMLIMVPTWLIFFSQLCNRDIQTFSVIWAVLVATSSIFVTGILAKYYQFGLSRVYEKVERPNPRLFDRTLSWLGACGSKINIFMLIVTLLVISAATLATYRHGLHAHNFVVILILYLGSTVVWYSEGVRLKKMPPYFIMQLCAFGAYAVIRRQIVLASPGFWRHEYDIWATLIISAIVSGLLQIGNFKAREIRVPLTVTLCAMPVLALIWCLSHHLGTNTLLLIVGLYSVIFVFMGKDDRESPYHVVAVSGFVAFLLILFWSKLELRVVHAYIIPVGIGMLVLLQMFHERIKPQVRNQVRFVTLMAMLGSAGYYVLIGRDINIVYAMIFGVLGLFAMILGSFFKIRLYLLLGFTGLIVDVCVIFCKLVMQMQRNTQMTIIGSLVLIGGVTIVAGAIFYKTHREKIMDYIESIRNKIKNWD